MIDNFNYLNLDEKIVFLTSKANHNPIGERVFLRFLKDYGLLSKFKAMFSDAKHGIKYREFLNLSNHAPLLEEQTIKCFFTTYRMKDYLLDAFWWGDDVSLFWYDMNREWMKYLEKSKFC